MSNIKAASYNDDITDNMIYDNEGLFGTMICEFIENNGRKSIFSMIQIEKDLSIFVMRNYVKYAKEIIEKNFGGKLDIITVDYLIDVLVYAYFTNMGKKDVRLSKKEDNDSITLPALSVRKLNTSGFDVTYRSVFGADSDKRCNALMGEDELMGLVCVPNDVTSLSNSRTSVSVCAYIDLSAIATAMQFVLFVRKYLYSEKLIL
ncbi:MAG: hypothetical protein J6S14_00290 [Clostridia bacterium]|nr:hypothetical protein [Clostridia bacterium]